jgi:hypothetical protein
MAHGRIFSNAKIVCCHIRLEMGFRNSKKPPPELAETAQILINSKQFMTLLDGAIAAAHAFLGEKA